MVPFAEDDSDQDEEDHEGDGGPQDSGPQGPQEDVAKHPDVQGHRVGRQHGDADVVLPHAERGGEEAFTYDVCEGLAEKLVY